MKDTVLEVIQNRRSVRRFAERPVEREAILTCIEAARIAPSAEHIQPWRFLIYDDPQQKKEFEEEVYTGLYRSTRWAMKAPVLVVILADLNYIVHKAAKTVQGTAYHLIDIGIAGEHLVLQAQKLGLGTCWIGWFSLRKAEKYLKLPSGMKVAQLIAMGYPSEDWSPKPKKRKSIDEITFFNSLKG